MDSERSVFRSDGVFDVIVSNPPYIPGDVIDTLMPEVRDFEPRLALEGADRGLAFYRKITDRAVNYLKPSGWLFFEIGCEQAADVSRMMDEKGFREIHTVRDRPDWTEWSVEEDRNQLEEKICLTD